MTTEYERALKKALLETEEVLSDLLEERGEDRKLARWASERKETIKKAHYDVVQAMFSIADDDDADVIERTLVRAGVLWQCPGDEGGMCNFVNAAEDETCGDCGLPRPSGRTPSARWLHKTTE